MKNSYCALVILSFVVCCYSGVVEISTNDEFVDFRATKSPQAIFYFHQKPGFVIEVLHAVSHKWEREKSESYMILGIVNCKIEGFDKNELQACSINKNLLMAYFNEKVENMGLEYLFNEIAFEAHMLYFIHQDQITIINDLRYWELYLQQAKGEKDVILLYFSAFGSLSNYIIMKFVHQHLNKYKFAFTNDKNFATEMGMPLEHQNGVWYASCSKTNYASKCSVYKQSFIGDLQYSSLHAFINFYGVPFVLEINDDGSTIYGNQLNLLFIFFDNDESKMELSNKMDALIINLFELGVNVRAVLVDSRKTPSLLDDYGIHENVMLPTVVLQYSAENSKTEYEGIERIIDPFPLDADLTKENIFKFVHDSILKPEKMFQKTNQMYGIQIYSSDELSSSKKLLTSEDQHVLVGGCTKHPDFLKICATFNANFRRLVRTIFSDSSIDFNYIYVDYKDGQTGSVTLPLLFFHDSRGGIKEFTNSEITYSKMLMWINLELGSAFKPLPFARSDFNNFNPIDIYGDYLHMTQEDEVSQDVLELKNKRLYADDVELLTDASFNKTVSENNFTVVLFFVRWDEKSYLFQSHYAKVKKSIEAHYVKMAKVDCGSQHHVCTFQKAYSYPTIRLFKNGQHLTDYKGFLDAALLEQSIRMHYSSPCIELEDNKLQAYIEGIEPSFVGPYADLSFLGWFSSQNDEALIEYKRFAEDNFGKALFAFSTGDKAKEILKISSDGASLFVYKRKDKLQPVSKYVGEFNKESLYKFTKTMFLEVFGELTPANLPSYRLFGQPLLVLFVSEKEKNSSAAYMAIEKLANDNFFTTVIPVWMNTEDVLSRKIRTRYIGLKKDKSSDLVVVNHTTGEVYHLSSSAVAVEEMINEIDKWLRDLESGKLLATSFLSTHQWKPLREGFDFNRRIEADLVRLSGSTSPEHYARIKGEFSTAGVGEEPIHDRKYDGINDIPNSIHDEF